MTRRHLHLVTAVAALLLVVACGKKTPPVAYPPAPNPGPNAFPGAGGVGAERPPDPPPVPGGGAVTATPLGAGTIADINDSALLQPVLFAYDSDEIDEAGKKILAANAQVLTTNRTWVITVEGHCDERGTAEYNLALGDRRALAVKNYLVSLGISAERLRTVSYGKEFPFAPGHDEGAWVKNRRAHFMVTSK